MCLHIMRRLSFYTKFFTVIGLSALIIITFGIRYTDNTTYYLTSVKSHRNTNIIVKVENEQVTYTQQIPIALSDDTHVSIEIENLPDMNENHSYSSSDEEYIKTTRKIFDKKTYNFTNITKNILEKARFKIKYDTFNYNLSQSGVNEIKDLIIESGGQPLRTLVVSTWRSGSTFTADLINNARPSTYYHNEPLFMYGTKQFRTPQEASEALSVVKRMLKCDYEGLDSYFECERKHFRAGSPSTRLWPYCTYEDNDELCFDAEVTSRLCKLFPFQNAKIERLRLQLVEEILDDKALNVKAVLLVRDPRGVMQSRRSERFCKLSPDCYDPSMLCADMVSDYVAAGRILQQHPDRLIVIRFEDLALQPDVTTNRILNFLNIERTQSFDDFVQSHTHVEVAGAHSTSRVSRDVPHKWRTALDFTYVTEIQLGCRDAMQLWGYKIAHNETHMKSKDFDPVDSYVIT